VIIAVTSVFFVPFFLSDTETEFLGRFRTRRNGEFTRWYPPPTPSPRSFGIIDLGGNSSKIFEE
jgi:hypothetical protein